MSVGVVTQHLYALIAKQVEDHRLIVWYDPDQVYSAAAEELELPNATIACYKGSFFQLRHDIDLLMNDEQPPRLVVYIPEDRGNIHHALIELEAAGAIIQPGQQPPNRNTRLAIVARHALKPILGDKTAAEIGVPTQGGTPIRHNGFGLLSRRLAVMGISGILSNASHIPVVPP